MGELRRIYGTPLTIILASLLTLWILGMIAAPLMAMMERAFVHVDRNDELAQVETRINRLSRDVATYELDIRVLEEQAGEGAEAGAASPGGFPIPSTTVPGAQDDAAAPAAPSLVPQMSVPSADNRPAPAAPPVPSLPSPSMSGSSADGGGEDTASKVAALEAKRDAARAEIAQAQIRAQELRVEKANAPRYSLKNFSTISPLHLTIFIKTIGYAAAVTLIAFVLCYPIAYAVSTARGARSAAIIALMLIIPYAINELLRVYAWSMILQRDGVLNALLGTIGLVGAEPPRWVASNNTVFLVMAYTFLLFMMFPLINILSTLDRNQVEAARDLGASVWRVHWRVVLPHAKPGIAMGAILVFMLSAGVITVPEIIGRGMHPDWFSQVIYRRFFESAAWNQGSAYSLMLLASCIAFILMVLAVFRVSIREIAK